MRKSKLSQNDGITKEFITAVLAEDLARVEDCLNNGADIDAPFFEYRATALGHSARQNKTALVNLLLKYKPDLDAENKHGNTPLAEAARYGHVASVISLLEAGGSTQIKNHVGNTPRMRAELNGHKLLAKRLLSAEGPIYNGFAKENDRTVSRHEILEASSMSILKVFNFATQEVTTVLESGAILQQFNEISQHRIDEAAEALRVLDGDPGDWAPLKNAQSFIKAKRVK